MGDTGNELEIEEEGSLHTEEAKSTARWILDKGLNIGKKIAITGFVISSAPLLLPPLVVISALGFVFSIPSGILLSSYACTEKLMSKLLPTGDYVYWEDGFLEDEDLKSEEAKGDGSAMGYAYDEDLGKYAEVEGNEDDPLTKTENTEQPSGHVTVMKDVQMKNRGVEEKVSEEENPSVEVAKKGDSEGKESNEQTEDDERSLTRETAQKADGRGGAVAGNKTDVGVAVVAEKTIKNASEPNKKPAKKRKGHRKDDAGARHEEVQKKKAEEQIIHPKNAEASDTPAKTPEDAVKLHSSAEAPDSKQAASIPTGKEVEPGEEKIWEKIDALRAIVGYKDLPHKTYVGELRALYMFTGVEAPASLLDSSDLAEANENLGFLMSIVGIK